MNSIQREIKKKKCEKIEREKTGMLIVCVEIFYNLLMTLCTGTFWTHD